MNKYRVNAMKYEEVYIDDKSVIKILNNEIDLLLGGEDRYVDNGLIYERDYRYDSDDIISEASEYVTFKYEALIAIINHFESKK